MPAAAPGPSPSQGRTTGFQPQGDRVESIPSNWKLPYSLEAERGVLGSMIVSPDAADMAEERLKEEAFFDPRHQTIFAALAHLRAKSAPVDVLTLRQRLEDLGQLGAVGGDAYLGQLVAEVPTPANIGSYAAIVRTKFLLRRAMASCAEIVRQIQETPDEAGPVLDLAEQEFYKISEDTTTKEAEPASVLVMPVMKLVERLFQNRGQVTGVATGFHDFDALTGGLKAGEMVVFAARPGVGKTSFAMNIAEHVSADLKKAVGVFTLEMTNEQIMLRLLASRARVDLKRIRDGFMSQRDFEQIAQAASELHQAPLYLDETVGVTLPQLRTKGRRMKKRYGIEMIVIDYLQLVQPGTIRRNDNRQADVAEISGGIKGLAKELGLPVIVLCQLNRKPDERGGQPRLSDLRESGAIEQDADIVGLLYRPEMVRNDDGAEGGPEGEAFLDIQKHRNGPTEKIKLTFLKQLTRFESYKRDAEPEGEA